MREVAVFEMANNSYLAGCPDEILACVQSASLDLAAQAPSERDIAPRRLTEAELDGLLLSTDENGRRYVVPITFRQHLDDLVARNVKFPCAFASLNERSIL